MLGMAFFKSLVKDHGKRYFEPVGKAMAAAGIRTPNPLNPRHAMVLAGVAGPYLRWKAHRWLTGVGSPDLPHLPPNLERHAKYACYKLPRVAMEIDDTMQKFQLKLADRQCRMAELSQRTQDLITMLVTALHAGTHGDPIVRDAGDLMCRNLHRKLNGHRATNDYFKQVTALGRRIAEGEADGPDSLDLGSIEPPGILERYDG